jgi:hypothetical protein
VKLDGRGGELTTGWGLIVGTRWILGHSVVLLVRFGAACLLPSRGRLWERGRRNERVGDINKCHNMKIEVELVM